MQNHVRAVTVVTMFSVTVLLVLSGCVTETHRVGRPVDLEKSLQAHVDLGLGYMAQGNLARAKEKLNRAMEIDPNAATVHNAYALLFQLENETEIAEQHFLRAIRLDPKYSAARNNFGAFLFSEGRYKEAIEQLEVGAQDPFYRSRSQVFENLGVCYLKTGDKKSAKEAFDHATSLNPRQTRSILELAELAYEQQDYSQAQNLYKRYLAISEQSARSLWLGIRVAQIFQKNDELASYALMLKNIFPASLEYKMYQESRQ